MSLIWTNHAALSEQRAEHLRTIFAAQLEGAQIRFVQGEAAPALRVSVEQTPAQIVFTASVPSAGSASVAIEEVARSLMGSDELPTNVIRLEKELLWQQETRILSAALPKVPANSEKKMVLLSDDALVIYREEHGDWKLGNTKLILGPSQPQRTARAQLFLAEEDLGRVGILLPGRRCEATLDDDSPVACSASNADWHAGRLLALPACGTQTWWLKSDTTDWTSEDHLQLRSSGAGSNGEPVTELSVPGPVISIGAGPNAESAAVVVRNLSTGNYEVYRVALACAN
jgi:hypothetical protein